jgi:hypothetical protein
VPVDELLLAAVVTEHLRGARRRAAVRAARRAPSYDDRGAVPRPRRAAGWDAALSAYARAASGT